MGFKGFFNGWIWLDVSKIWLFLDLLEQVPEEFLREEEVAAVFQSYKATANRFVAAHGVKRGKTTS